MDPLDHFTSEKMHGGFYQKLVLSLLILVNFMDGCFMMLGGLLIPHLQAIYALSTAQISLIGSMIGVGYVSGALFVGELSRKFGRAPLIKLAMIFLLLTGAGAFFCDGYYSFAALFAGFGFFLGLNSIIITTYNMEIAPLAKRGRWIVFMSCFLTAGRILAVYFCLLLIDDKLADSWKYPVFALAVLAAVFTLVIFVFLEESPRFLIARRKYQEFLDLFNKILRTNAKFVPEKERKAAVTLEEVVSLSEAIISRENRKRQKVGSRHHVFSPKYFWMTLTLITMWSCVVSSFDGEGFIMPFLFNDRDNRYGSLIMILTLSSEFLAMLLTFNIIDRVGYGRKRSLQGYSLFVTLLFAALFFSTNIYLAAGLFFLTRFALKASLILLVAYCGELYPTGLRATALGRITGLGGVVTVALPFVIFPLYDWDRYSVFVFFGVTTLVIFLLSTRVWADRTRKSLDISQSLIAAEV